MAFKTRVNELLAIRYPIAVDTARMCEQALGRELYGRGARSGVHPLVARSAA